MSFYRTQLEQYLKTLSVTGVVLDIGGGQGSVQGRVGEWGSDEYEVLDLPDWDLNESWWENGRHRQADVVFCLEVFEYLYNPVVAMENIHGVLKKGGRAYISFAFVYPHHNELEMDSLRYTEPGIRRLADHVGLTITNITYRRDKSGLLESFYRADGMRMAKEYLDHNVTGFIVEMKK